MNKEFILRYQIQSQQDSHFNLYIRKFKNIIYILNLKLNIILNKYLRIFRKIDIICMQINVLITKYK